MIENGKIVGPMTLEWVKKLRDSRMIHSDTDSWLIVLLAERIVQLELDLSVQQRVYTEQLFRIDELERLLYPQRRKKRAP